MGAAGEILGFIVHRVLGRQPARITMDELASIARDLGTDRRSAEVRSLSDFCRLLVAFHENQNYQSQANGEEWLLSRLVDFDPKVVFDVGANEGDWSVLVRQILPAADLHAFEVVDETYRKLVAKVGPGPKFFANPFGLSNESGHIQIHVYGRSNRLSSYLPYPHGDHEVIPCPVMAGGAYLLEKGIEHIDLLKVDVEGAERLVLNGFEEALCEHRIDVVQFEYGKASILSHYLLRDYYQLFEQRGYSVGKLFPDGVEFRDYSLDDEDFRGPNYVACRNTRPDMIEALRAPV